MGRDPTTLRRGLAHRGAGRIAANDFPERAGALAAEIADRQPHLVGLQEVYDFTLDGANGPPPFRDHLADLQAALAARGLEYRVAAVVRNMDVTLPLPFGTIRVVDRDVILARRDVDTAVVPLALSGCRASLGGCNFQFVAEWPTLAGPIAFERGFMAVDARVAGQSFRVVNTHLEQRLAAFPLLAVVQAAQAFELVATVGAFPAPPGTRLLVLGDLNSSPEHEVVIVDGFPPGVPPYAQLIAAGYADAWLLRPGHSPGLTCCQLEDLSSPTSVLAERVDLIFSRETPLEVKANVIGNETADMTVPSQLWPSDHAGVVATLDFAP